MLPQITSPFSFVVHGSHKSLVHDSPLYPTQPPQSTSSFMAICAILAVCAKPIVMLQPLGAVMTPQFTSPFSFVVHASHKSLVHVSPLYLMPPPQSTSFLLATCAILAVCAKPIVMLQPLVAVMLP